MKEIKVVFNPHKPAPYKYGSRLVAIDAALAADFVPTAQEVIDSIRASKDTTHLRFQKPQKISVVMCENISLLSARMYFDLTSSEYRNQMGLFDINPVRTWILCAIHRGIKLGIL